MTPDEELIVQVIVGVILGLVLLGIWYVNRETRD